MSYVCVEMITRMRNAAQYLLQPPPHCPRGDYGDSLALQLSSDLDELYFASAGRYGENEECDALDNMGARLGVCMVSKSGRVDAKKRPLGMAKVLIYMEELPDQLAERDIALLSADYDYPVPESPIELHDFDMCELVLPVFAPVEDLVKLSDGSIKNLTDLVAFQKLVHDNGYSTDHFIEKLKHAVDALFTRAAESGMLDP